MLSLTNFAAEVERERARQRTYDALLRKARAGQVTGGRVYGYDNVDVWASTPGPDGRPVRLHVVRRVNPEQAAVVRRIFELCAAGLGVTRIAKLLNAERIPPPRKARGWAPTAIREMLHRPLYRGELVWSRSQKVDRGGTKKRRERPEAAWLRLDAPELRIVPETLWRDAHARLEQTRRAIGGGHRRVTPHPCRMDLDSPYLLAGLGRCMGCGGALIAMTRAHGNGRKRFYGCANNHKRGQAVCANSLQIRQDLLDQAVLQALADVLDERVVEAAIDRALERLRAGQETDLDRRTVIERELSLIEAREQRLVEGIARGDRMDPLLAQLKAEESRKSSLTHELAALVDQGRLASLESRRLRQEPTRRVADVRELLARHEPGARRLLQTLLVDRLGFTPFEENGKRGYRFEGEATYGGLLAGLGIATSDGVPDGIRTRVSRLKIWGPRPA